MTGMLANLEEIYAYVKPSNNDETIAKVYMVQVRFVDLSLKDLSVTTSEMQAAGKNPSVAWPNTNTTVNTAGETIYHALVDNSDSTFQADINAIIKA